MTQHIEIANGVVRLVERSIVREMPLSTFQNTLVTTKAYTTPRLPVDCVFVIGLEGTDYEQIAWTVERPPRTVNMRIHDKEFHNPEEMHFEEFEVEVPWQYWTIVTSMNKPPVAAGSRRVSSYAYYGTMYHWSDVQLESPDDIIYEATIPNSRGITNFCTGSTDMDSETLDGLIDGIVNNWWEVPFTTHLGWLHPYEFGELKEWEDAGRTPDLSNHSNMSLRQAVEQQTGMASYFPVKGMNYTGEDKWSMVGYAAYQKHIQAIYPEDLFTLEGLIIQEANERRERLKKINEERLEAQARRRAADAAVKKYEATRLAAPTEDATLAAFFGTPPAENQQ